jgi:AP2-associated kinase
MYRPPEIVDPFKKYKVSRQVDVWMLGCVLYTLIYFTHPFIDASKAGIANAAFRISTNKCS